LTFGTLILLPIYAQSVLHISATGTGLLLLPGEVLLGVLAPYVGHLYDRNGPTALLVSGAVVVTIAFSSLASLDAHSSAWRVLAGHSALSLGLAFLFTPLLTAGLAALRPELYPHGSAIMGTIQQVAAAMGIAIYVSILSLEQTRLGGHGVAETAAGIQQAFVVGALVSTAIIPAAAMIRRPPATIGVKNPVRLH
jgi:DHA2 family lincomycin resistance protein-like MFS transporter